MKAISLFAGIGGFDLALTRLGHKVVYANEWDKYAVQTYEKNFKTKPDTRDITTIPTAEIPKHDLLVGGFPCQAFSIAGKRQGFNETRGTLFFNVARILSDKKPRYFILENVKGLLSHDGGRTFKIIISTLDELGYDLQWQVLNSKNFGVPQNRERVFIIGNIRGKSRPKIFPLKESPQILRESKFKTKNSIAHTLRAKEGEPSIEQTYISRYPLKFLNRNQRNIEGDYAYTIDSANTGGLNVDGVIRRLTPLECERLQGFPDGWTEGVSDTQRYKQLGNAVTVNVVEWIISRL